MVTQLPLVVYPAIPGNIQAAIEMKVLFRESLLTDHFYSSSGNEEIRISLNKLLQIHVYVKLN